MMVPWLHTPYLDIRHVSKILYGSSSRLYVYRLRQKMNGIIPFESWELDQLETIKVELLQHIHEGSPSSVI
ncbi:MULTISPECIES: hypothetical protein [Xanthocytophaga]|nr:MULTISPECIES: hypothetical protein [Xanthocytophaga]MDJ1504018.1 hypothetical protein [Xanthocytophaga agilis]